VKRAVCLCALLIWLVAWQPLVHAQTFTILYQFKSGPNGVMPAAGVTLDPKRRALYGTTERDGKFASGTVYGFNKNGETALYSFTNEQGDGAFPAGNSYLLLDSAGNLYGATDEGGISNGGDCSFGCGIVFQVSQTGKETILHEFTGGDDGESPRGPLVGDAAGNVYGMTFRGGTADEGILYKINHTGKFTVMHSFGAQPGDGELPEGGLVRDKAGNLYGTTMSGGALGAGTVFKIDPGGNESVFYSFGANFPDGLEPINELTIDAAGNLYGMTDDSLGFPFGFGVVFKVNPSGQETVLHNFVFVPDAQTPILNGLAVDPSGTVYGVTNGGGDFGLGAVFKIDTAGNETVIHSFSGPDGQYPYGGLARDPQGNLYGTTSEGGAFGGGVIYRIKP